MGMEVSSHSAWRKRSHEGYGDEKGKSVGLTCMRRSWRLPNASAEARTSHNRHLPSEIRIRA